MRSPRRHPLTLRFSSDEREAAFERDYFERSRTGMRLAILFGAFLFGVVFGLHDLLPAGPETLVGVWSIRGAVCGFALGVFLFTYSAAFERYAQEALSLLLLAAGFGLVGMMMLEEVGVEYHDGTGPALLILAGYVVLRLRFIYAAAAGWIITGAYAAVALWLAPTPTRVAVGGITFMVPANLIGMFAAYALESYARDSFVQAQVIEEKRAENERLLQIRSRFFANISHEFRTPLTLILGPLDHLLAAHAPGDPARESLEIMRRNARRLLRLIDQLLDLSKLDAGSLHLLARRTDVVPFLKGVIFSFSSYAASKHITLQFEAEQEELALYFDADKLEKVVVNLLSNALKFTPEGGTIRLSVAGSREGSERAPEGWVEIAVKDSGNGIPPEDLPHIFDRFYQAEGAAMRRQKGTGIGLALTKELVELHSGAVWASSEVGFGSTFTVRLPRGREHLEVREIIEDVPGAALPDEVPGRSAPALPEDLAARPPRRSVRAASAPSEAETVLIVEDNADVRAYVRDCLGEAYRVLEARDGAEGLERARADVPDLILTDLKMPEMDGFAFCRAVKADPILDHIPVVMLTARASEASKVEGLELGADDYLYKPFNARELQARVRNLIASRRKLRQRFSREVLVQPGDVTVASAEEAFIEQACRTVEAHLDDVHFNVDAFAEEMGMSLRQLQRKLRALTGETPNAFIRLLRLKRGAQLLEQHYGTVSEVAYAVGFNHPTYFTKCFGEVFGTSPTEYAAQ